MFTKGGITGLPEDDFDYRQKSGNWTIQEHFDDVNYIRSRDFTPNNYLAIGGYEGKELTIYSMFLNKKTRLSKDVLNDATVTCMAYNRHINHLAIGLNKEPYLRAFFTWPGPINELDISGGEYLAGYIQIEHPVFVRRFRYRNLVDDVFHVKHNLDDPMPAVAMVSSTRDVSYPYHIRIIDENQIDIVFDQPPTNISGIIYIHSFKKYIDFDWEGNTVHDLDTFGTEPFGEDYTSYFLDLVTTNHDMPIFHIYSAQNQMIFPAAIYEITQNNLYRINFPNGFDPTGVKVLVIQGFENYSQEFTPNPDLAPVLVNHNLDSRYLFFQVFDTVTNRIIYPDNINITDKYNISVSSEDLIQERIYRIDIIKSPPESGIPEFLISKPPESPVFNLEYDSNGDRLMVGVLKPEPESNSYLIEYDTQGYAYVEGYGTQGYGQRLRFQSLEAFPSTISIDQDNKHIFVGHYLNKANDIDRNLTLYDYDTRRIIEDEYVFNNLKKYTIDSVPDSLFIKSERLLIFSNYYKPFISFYDYIQKEDLTDRYYKLIENSIETRVKHLIKTSDDRYLLISVDHDPYLFVFEFLSGKIWKLGYVDFVSSFTSISLSVNDRYLCVTQREEPKLLVFEFNPTLLKKVDINYEPLTTPISSIFFFGPVSSEA